MEVRKEMPNVEERKMETRKIAAEFNKIALELIKENKPSQAIQNLANAIALYDYTTEDVRLLSSCYISLGAASLMDLKNLIAQNKDVDIGRYYSNAINMLSDIAEKNEEDFFKLGKSYFSLGKLQILFKEYDSAAELIVKGAENFINCGDFQLAQEALAEFEKIKPFISMKNPRLKCTFFQPKNDNVTTKEASTKEASAQETPEVKGAHDGNRSLSPSKRK